MSAIILFVGDASWDESYQVPHMPKPDEKVFAARFDEGAGGVAANSAAAARGLTPDVLAVLAIGGDAVGSQISTDLSRVGLELLPTHGDQSTRVVTLTDPSGEKRLVLRPGSPMYPTAEAIDLAFDKDRPIAWMHTAAYDIRSAAHAVERCRNTGARWSLDLEPATFPDGIDSLSEILDGAELTFCNNAAASQIGNSAVARLFELGVKNVVRTLGSNGASLYSAANPNAHIHIKTPSFDMSIVDTTGAGDCLAGWCVAELHNGCGLVESLRRAVHAATLSCSKHGGFRSYPSQRDVEDLEQELSATHFSKGNNNNASSAETEVERAR